MVDKQEGEKSAQARKDSSPKPYTKLVFPGQEEDLPQLIVRKRKSSFIEEEEEKEEEPVKFKTTLFGGSKSEKPPVINESTGWKSRLTAIIGGDKVSRRRRSTILAALLFIAMITFTFVRSPGSASSQYTRPVVVQTPGASILDVVADSSNEVDMSHARNSAHGFTQALWTYDYRWPDEYVSRIAPYCNSELKNRVVLMSQSQESQSLQLIESGKVSLIDLSPGSDRKTASAKVSVDVKVFQQNRTVNITDTLNLDTPDDTLGKVRTADMEVTLSVEGNRWIVTDFKMVGVKPAKN